MLEVHHKNNTLITQVHGTFTQEHFNNAFIPIFEAMLKEFPEVNIVLKLNNELTGWTLLALLKQFRRCIAPYDGINRLAIVSDNRLLKWRFSLFKFHYRISTKRFFNKDIEKAKAWLAIG
jgi:hypothetical protein